MTAIVDTSYLVALANSRDANHARCVAVAGTLRERLIVPQVVLPEASYLVAKYLGNAVMVTFVKQVTGPAFISEPLQGHDIERAIAVLEQYSNLGLDFADACIVALAERLNVKRVLTLDRRHFLAIRPNHITAFEILPP